MTDHYSARLAKCFLEEFGHEGRFTVGSLPFADLNQLVAAFEELGCRIEWNDPARDRFKVYCPDTKGSAASVRLPAGQTSGHPG